MGTNHWKNKIYRHQLTTIITFAFYRLPNYFYLSRVMIISEFYITSSKCLITNLENRTSYRHHTIAEMNEIIQASILQYQTSFLKIEFSKQYLNIFKHF